MNELSMFHAHTDDPVDPYPGPVDDPGEVERERPPPPRDPAEPWPVEDPTPVGPEPVEAPPPDGPVRDTARSR
jgi:hypothetical protein